MTALCIAWFSLLKGSKLCCALFRVLLALLELCSGLVTTGLGQVRPVFAGWTQGAGHWLRSTVLSGSLTALNMLDQSGEWGKVCITRCTLHTTHSLTCQRYVCSSSASTKKIWKCASIQDTRQQVQLGLKGGETSGLSKTTKCYCSQEKL